MTTFRDTAWILSPARLRTTRAARMVYAFIGLPLDMIAEAADQAAKVMDPLSCPEDALSYHGRDRGIRRGPLESATSYRQRLLLWIEAWRGAGVGRAMLDQIAGYLTPQTCRMRIWTQGGVIYTREADGTFSVSRYSVRTWNWDGLAALWSRFWVIIDSVGGVPWSRDGTWGDGERWGDNASSATWGSTATIDQVQSIRGIVDDWKPAASVCKNIIVSFDAYAFSTEDFGPPFPDGTWAHWGRYDESGVKRAARDPRAIYWRGVA